MTKLIRTSGLAILASVLLAWTGTAAAQCPVQPGPGEKLVIIMLADGHPKVSADPVQIKAEAETVHWCYADGNPLITFKPNPGDHPFAEAPKHQSKHVRSGTSVHGKVGKFRYTVTVPVPGGPPAILDPVVEVMP